MNSKLPGSSAPPSSALAALAVALWIASLPLTGLVLYSSQTTLMGLYILAIGWLGLLLGNVAWFANVAFLVAVAMLFVREGPARYPALVAFVLSLDTFRFHTFYLNEGGTKTAVYGYGWGAITWLCAMCVILIAAGTREIELAPDKKRSFSVRSTHLRMSGFIALITVLCVTVVFAISDRRTGNAAEKVRLSGLAFKRGAVCQLEGPIPAVTLQLTGPLEVVIDGNPEPFESPRHLLEWGIPIVRMNGLDYSLVEAGKQKLITAKKADGSSSARLLATGNRTSGYRTVLSSLDGAVVSFDQIWKPEAQGVRAGAARLRYCPEYSTYPETTEQPRKGVMSALQTPNARWFSEGGDSRQRHTEIGRLEFSEATVVERQSDIVESMELRNRGCQANDGLQADFVRSHPEARFLGRPFSLQGVLFFTESTWFKDAVCFEDHTYLLGNTAASSKDFHIIISKRSLSNFEEVWTRSTTIPRSEAFLQQRTTVVRSLRETNEVLKLDLLNPSTRDLYKVNINIQVSGDE